MSAHAGLHPHCVHSQRYKLACQYAIYANVNILTPNKFLTCMLTRMYNSIGMLANIDMLASL